MQLESVQYFKQIIFASLCCCCSVSIPATTLRVGPDHLYQTPSQAAKVAGDGDVIEIEAGVYTGDVAVWVQDNLILRGVGGRPHLKAFGNAAEGKAIWVIKGNDTTIENLEFSGAVVADGNGAGIRQQGRNLTIRHSYFHDNEMGILTSNRADSDIKIEYSEFSHSRRDNNGIAHNIYIGRVNSLVFRFNYSHHANFGHLLKSRAKTNHILFNRFSDEQTGRSSYAVNIPNGGHTLLMGNIFHQGKATRNIIIFSHGEEGGLHQDSQVQVFNNTFVSELRQGIFIRVAEKNIDVRVMNNIFSGASTIQYGSGITKSNLVTTIPGFVDKAAFNYHLTKSSSAIDSGSNLDEFLPSDIKLNYQYRHVANKDVRTIVNKIDIGAFEYLPDE